MHYLLDHALRLVWLGEAYLRSGRRDEASTQAQRALEFSRIHQERSREAYALRLLGDVASQCTPPEGEQAETCYQQALALADELGIRPLMAHCHLGLGMLHRQMGRHAMAHVALSTALDLYRAMGMTFWLPQVEAALAHVGAAATPQAS
jgi:tetratricopeptide (TPR) repeat protein